MKSRINQLLEDVESFVADTNELVEEFRIKYLGKKGEITELFGEFKNIAVEERKEVGQLINNLKNKAQEKIDEMKVMFEGNSQGTNSDIDFTLPVNFTECGARHPLSIIRNEVCSIFSRIGYGVEEGPEIEDDWHNFSALNFPPNHPARDMQDTFFIEKSSQMGNDIALRTHTSSSQVRKMEKGELPIRSLFPGRVYRNEAISARAHCFFHQVEGLYIDENVSFADLKQTLMYFAKEMFGESTEIRLRPSYFPFTEPSAEMDVSCGLCGGKGCNVCKGTGWLEILGCGMVDPNVLEECGIDSKRYSGFAFGMGIERIAMLKYRVNDLRLYSENDVRFLSQFEAAY